MKQVSKKQSKESCEQKGIRFTKNTKNLSTIGETMNIGIPHVGEQILQHLNTDDLIECFKVSKVWKVLAENVFFQRWKGKMMEACRTGRTKTVQLLLDNYLCEEIGLNVKDSSGNTPFALACQHGHTNTVQLLLEYSANIDLKAQNNMGWTPIMEACHSGRTEIVKLLLENCDSGKIGLNIKDMDGNTPFMKACKRRSAGVVKLLLNNEVKSINWDARDEAGYTPFMIACMKGYVEIVELLLNHTLHKTIDFNAKLFEERTYTNWTACMLAIFNKRGNVVKLLLQHSKTKNIEMPRKIHDVSIHRIYPHPESRTKRLRIDSTYFNT